MSRNWTKEQLEAINSPTFNILVSAGAGSGKTAVLTQRVITLLEKGMNINELLVLTFTNAAAAEMKERIRKAIKKNEHLKEQLDLLDSAYITTFDSYALSLVKKYHYLLGLSSNVKIVNEAALQLEKYKIIDEVMESRYNEKKECFIKLINNFCLKDDSDFKELIFEINNKFDLLVEKEAFLNNYKESLNGDRINKLWNAYLNKILLKLNEIRELYYEIENSLESNEDEEMFEEFSKTLEILINSDDFNVIALNINFDLTKFRKTKNISEIFIENKKKIGVIRNEIKDLIECNSKEMIIKSLKENFIFEEEIIEIVKEVNEKINYLKFTNQMFEFIDIAKLAIKLIKNNENIRNEIKYSIKEIMLDEYQDTSDLQEILISYISNNNVYMVGDIKQSIYRFRNANPRIFLDKYNKYSLNENEGKVINLMRNFRSRKEVLDDINIMFNEIMNKDYGGVDYKKGHEFIYGNLSYSDNEFESQSNNLEIYNYLKEKDNPYTSEEIEAFIIGRDIINKINGNYMVYDKDNGIKRKMEYGDITVLLDRKSTFDTYQKIFEYLGVPLTSYKNNNLTLSSELLCFKNIFKLILKYNLKEFDNEFKHAFMSVARSFIFEYEDKYLFEIISSNEYYSNSIYESLKEIIDNLDYLNIIDVTNMIIDKLDVYYKLIKCANIEGSSAIIEYIISLMGDLNELEYDLERVIEYFDSVISKELKIELPVRKSSVNSVKIMTIHASKGLEFNLCYFAGFRKKFSEFDSKKKFIYSNDYGLLLPLFIDNKKYINIGKYLYMDNYYDEEISEKIRLLYVALSRAKEKMIIVGDFSDSKTKKENLGEARNFYDLVKYAENKLSSYYKFIDINDYDINDGYKYFKSLKTITNDNKINIVNKTININNEVIEEKSFSKKQNTLLNEETIAILNKGNYLHDILSKLDFNNFNLNKYNLNELDKKIINKFINCSLLNNINHGKVYKEYEFIYENNQEIKHGFIDLMIVYDNYIDIIDYKLSNIEDEAYINQLKGYKEYIYLITNKEVNLYLYSLFKGEYKKID